MADITVKVLRVPSVKLMAKDLKLDEDEVHARMHMIALEGEREAKRVAPVDTGTLRNSIRTGSPRKLEWHVSANTNYAAFVEFGTRHAAAQPYMRPAAKRMRDLIRLVFGRR